MPRFIKIV